MYTFLIVLILVLSVALCLIVLIQKSKGGGLASGFSSTNQIMGVPKMTDFIEKLTWGLAAGIVILSIATVYVLPSAPTSQDGNRFLDQAQKQQVENPYNFQDQGVSTTVNETPIENSSEATTPAESDSAE
ncbi:preprotein translocase, SecG subunit [Bacteroides coprosuis DSM 18011]|uniref:Protein-export membrane protein SecG n=1 Tax=Bacteroides coprosuis DSM 18011 TaxID=679937 RepID=F3ZNL4_9BACE|nr:MULTISPECIES: preprotein translocase subunit SecG [Bacteroides]EGJ72549.1 preprotein translocase, SecG subunit [Bacteroides coprosuis DSM 18011]